jgi:hypothetical protein
MRQAEVPSLNRTLHQASITAAMVAPANVSAAKQVPRPAANASAVLLVAAVVLVAAVRITFRPPGCENYRAGPAAEALSFLVLPPE